MYTSMDWAGFIGRAGRVWRAAGLVLLMGHGAESLMAAPGGFTKGREVAPLSPDAQPGDYVWMPEVSPDGPVVVIVSIPQQAMFVYRNGVRIGRSTVSTGKEGHATPTGVFTILQKKVDHESSIYRGAKMPHMQRLTWDGIAMHAGRLPGYPASHGCVRLPEAFAEKLFSVTKCGTSVIVTDQAFAPGSTANPGLLLSGLSEGQAGGQLPVSGFEWQPEKATNGTLSVVFSMPDSVAYVYRNGVQIGRAVFALNKRDVGTFQGSHVYSALATQEEGGRPAWLSVTSIGGGAPPDIKGLAERTAIPLAFLARVRPLVEAGTTLILTDLPVSPQTQSGQDFRILTADSSPGRAE